MISPTHFILIFLAASLVSALPIIDPASPIGAANPAHHLQPLSESSSHLTHIARQNIALQGGELSFGQDSDSGPTSLLDPVLSSVPAHDTLQPVLGPLISSATGELLPGTGLPLKRDNLTQDASKSQDSNHRPGYGSGVRPQLPAYGPAGNVIPGLPLQGVNIDGVTEIIKTEVAHLSEDGDNEVSSECYGVSAGGTGASVGWGNNRYY
ncbi:hypothetical protein CPC08DRAFT_753927 [Agrocybe pediades]|nr:hypothetical protein CPC08DRAFT_753927 [Agrocybe pediades]